MRLSYALALSASITALVGMGRASPSTPGGACPPPPPEVDLRFIFEVNATDDDGEVVLEINTDAAIERLTVFDPAHRPVLGVRSNDRRDLGLSEVLLETAEPSIQGVKRAYPEGRYLVHIRTTDRRTIRLATHLSHDLPDEPVILAPLAGASVPANGVVVTWQGDPDVATWNFELEQDDLGLSLNVLLPGNVTRFAIPDGFLVSGEEFDLGVAAIAADTGNVLVVEQTILVL